MSTPKYVNFFNQLNTVVNSLDTTDVKLTIGDSINNNRSLTVNQVIRFLLSSNVQQEIELGLSLQSVYGLIKADLLSSRINNRTDALDINEFINFYSTEVIGNTEYGSVIGRSLVA